MTKATSPRVHYAVLCGSLGDLYANKNCGRVGRIGGICFLRSKR
jgi:hypothetical protein